MLFYYRSPNGLRHNGNKSFMTPCMSKTICILLRYLSDNLDRNRILHWKNNSLGKLKVLFYCIPVTIVTGEISLILVNCNYIVYGMWYADMLFLL